MNKSSNLEIFLRAMYYFPNRNVFIQIIYKVAKLFINKDH